MYAEFAYRSLTAGFYGAITQQFRRAEPRWAAVLVVGAGIPVVSHTIEFAVHKLRGTPHLRSSMIASVCFTVISTLFNLHAMREGVLLAGEGSGSLLADLRSLPRVVRSFVVGGVRSGARLKKNC
jgi:MFS superfamily sulfate permease-like transporter